MALISALLDDFETEALAGILGDEIVKNRQFAKVEHATGQISDEQLAWHLGHAEFLETIAKKLFPHWRMP